ncbi:aig2 family protein [Colletotrichum incanum]|uniref:gamma-glutamylcyclotransferase n=1 Tax=Colletotrichum incanum TaxID=1573173 RepID=A0A162MYE1_COLIC|nr:aig2 family protein [Colletotrichum incanum]OHW93620.1 aig2 family protein [Colletotrichum incanum]
MTAPTPRLYFAYGSNLSPTQMALRCPSSIPVGLVHLPGYTFIINSRGYANVVRNAPPSVAPSSGQSVSVAEHNTPPPLTDPTNPGVYGILYTLPPTDEAILDRCEGVPHAYQKEELPVTVVSTRSSDPSSAASPPAPSSDGSVHLQKGANVTALVYVDNERTEPSSPRTEYIDRMNRGVDEATKLFGLPAGYVDRVIRPYITAPETPIVDTTAIADPFL